MARALLVNASNSVVCLKKNYDEIAKVIAGDAMDACQAAGVFVPPEREMIEEKKGGRGGEPSQQALVLEKGPHNKERHSTHCL